MIIMEILISISRIVFNLDVTYMQLARIGWKAKKSKNGGQEQHNGLHL